MSKNTATIGDFTAQPWEVVSLDFTEAMLKLQNCDVILVVLFVFLNMGKNFAPIN
jgi:hypothetical protein